MEEAKKIRGGIIVDKVTIDNAQEKVKNIPSLKQEIESSFDKSVTQVLEIILIGAINLDSSDIHVEPEKEKAKIRIRMDGILHDVLSMDKNISKDCFSNKIII